MLNLALTFNHKESLLTAERGLLLKRYHMFYSGVLYACNYRFFHIFAAKIQIFGTDYADYTDFF